MGKCPRCGRNTMLADTPSGELFCGSCGSITRDKIEETGPEWRAFSREEQDGRARAGSPSSVASHDMGLSTVIGSSNEDASGKMLSGMMRSTVERIRVWDRRSQAHQSADRNMRQAFSELRSFSDRLAVSQAVIERAAYIYRKALQRNLLRGRSIRSFTAASLYAACRDREVPRTLKDVAEACNINRKELARSYRFLLKELDLHMPIENPVRCVAKIASRAIVPEKIQRRALHILAQAEKMMITAGKDPMGLAASALYVASTLEGEYKSQRDLAKAAGVTEVTLRNRYKGLMSSLAILTPGD